jgi:lysophospholipase L1-like esterase
LALLGDSIAFGVGADRTEDRLAPRLGLDLESAGLPTITRVFAWSGARSADLRRQVERALPWRPDVVLLVIGANDLTHQVPPGQAAEDLRQAVRGLRGIGTEVVLAPAPDLSVVPHVPPRLREFVRARSAEFRQLQTQAAIAEGAVVADAESATSVSFGADLSLFSGDRFHPSSAGYARIADELAPIVREAAFRTAASRPHRGEPPTPR